jgi:hypothetical protein
VIATLNAAGLIRIHEPLAAEATTTAHIAATTTAAMPAPAAAIAGAPQAMRIQLRREVPLGPLEAAARALLAA